MRPRARLLAAAGTAALVGSLAWASDTSFAGPIEDSGEAARRIPFSARVEVSWVDSAGLHTAQLGVRSVGGRIRIQGPSSASGAQEHTVLRDSGLASSGDAQGLLVPDVARKYELLRGPGPVVAGRETEEVVVRAGGEVRERLAIDKATRLVLRREVFGPEGRPVRVVTVLQLDTAPVPDASGAAERPATGPRFLRVGDLPSRYRAPETLAGGYRRVGAYRHDRIVHLLYTDGLHGLSLFSQPGVLAGDRLPAGGQPVRIGTGAGVRYTWPGGEVITWQSGSLVHTLIGDGPLTDLLAAAQSVPPPGRLSILARVRGTSRLVAELVSGGR